MAFERSDLVGRPIVDFKENASADLVVEHAVDITEHLPKAKEPEATLKALLLYAKPATGNELLVYLVDCFEGKDDGAKFSWSLGELTNLPPDTSSILKAYAEHYGLTEERFIALMQEHAPAVAV
jgi:hypothetical protein